jgi:hypothetical protein
MMDRLIKVLEWIGIILVLILLTVAINALV